MFKKLFLALILLTGTNLFSAPFTRNEVSTETWRMHRIDNGWYTIYDSTPSNQKVFETAQSTTGLTIINSSTVINNSLTVTGSLSCTSLTSTQTVPYTGAWTETNLGTHSLTVDLISAATIYTWVLQTTTFTFNVAVSSWLQVDRVILGTGTTFGYMEVSKGASIVGAYGENNSMGSGVAGGSVTIRSGTGGTGGSNGGDGGDLTISAGQGGIGSTGNRGSGGDLILTGGNRGTSGASGDGGNVSISAGLGLPNGEIYISAPLKNIYITSGTVNVSTISVAGQIVLKDGTVISSAAALGGNTDYDCRLSTGDINRLAVGISTWTVNFLSSVTYTTSFSSLSYLYAPTTFTYLASFSTIQYVVNLSTLDYVSRTASTNLNMNTYNLLNVATMTATGNMVFSGGTEGEPTRPSNSSLMWYANKSAFRAGYATTEWDDANVGSYSTAFGRNNEASGIYSFAAGFENTASGNSIVLGKYIHATEANTIAIGLGQAIGNPLLNNIPNSLMVGFNSATPSFTVFETSAVVNGELNASTLTVAGYGIYAGSITSAGNIVTSSSLSVTGMIIGTSITVSGNVDTIANSASASFRATTYNNAATTSPTLLFKRAKGNIASPTAITGDADYKLFTLVASGYDGTGFTTNSFGIMGYSDGPHTSTSTPTYFTVETSSYGYNVRKERFKIGSYGMVTASSITLTGNITVAGTFNGATIPSTAPASSAISTGTFSMRLPGDLYVSSIPATGLGEYMLMGSTITIIEVRGMVVSYSTNSNIIADLHIVNSSFSHTSIWTTQSNRLIIPPTTYMSAPVTTFDTAVIPKDSTLSLHMDSTGNTNLTGDVDADNAGALPGSNFTLYIKYYKNNNQ